jgi:hypothetical protein
LAKKNTACGGIKSTTGWQQKDHQRVTVKNLSMTLVEIPEWIPKNDVVQLSRVDVDHVELPGVDRDENIVEGDVNHAPQTVEINDVDLPTPNPAKNAWYTSVEVETLGEAAEVAAKAAEILTLQDVPTPIVESVESPTEIPGIRIHRRQCCGSVQA